MSSNPFLADIMIVGFNFAPRGWAQCNGQILSINQNQSLFALLGTTFGGDGRTTFGLPDMRGRAPLHVGTGPGGTNRSSGEKGGQDKVALTTAQMPAHTHQLNASTDDATALTPGGNLPGTVVPAFNVYGDTANAGGNPDQVTPTTGGGQRHNNLQPYLTLKFVIALQGLFPSRN